MARSTVPARVDDCPVVQGCLAKATELKAEIQRLENDFNGINAGIAGAGHPSKVDAAAERYLDGDDFTAATAMKSTLLSQLESTSDKLRVVRGALAINDRRLGEARSKSSQRIAATRKAPYAEVLKRMKPIVEAVIQAANEEAAFRAQAMADDVQLAAVCYPLPLATGYLTRWLADAAEHYGL